jgi:hypothetical protein
LEVEFARTAGVSKQAITKALRHGKLARDAGGGIDPEHPVNAAWLALHRDDFSSNGRADTHSHAGRLPAAEPASAAKVAPRHSLRRTETGNDPSAPLDEGGIDLAQLAAELRLDELPPRPALDEEQRRLRIPGSALLNLDGLLNNVAKSIADGFNREGGMLVKVLTGIDDRLTAIERRVCRQQQCRDCGAARGTGRGAGRSCPGARRPLRLLIAVFTVLHAALGFLRSPAWSRSSRRWPPRSIR